MDWKKSTSPRYAQLFPRYPNYSNKVLIGNWKDDRWNKTDRPRSQMETATTYGENFDPKPPTRDTKLYRDLKIDAEDTNFIRVTDLKHPVLYNNFSTINDLTYNHFPKWSKTAQVAKYDYLTSYGNITNYGLIDYKRHEWFCDNQDPRTNLTTSYRFNFEAPRRKDYVFNRFGLPM